MKVSRSASRLARTAFNCALVNFRLPFGASFEGEVHQMEEGRRASPVYSGMLSALKALRSALGGDICATPNRSAGNFGALTSLEPT